MPSGDAERIRKHVIENHVNPARRQGEESVAIRVGDVRDGAGLELNSAEAINRICQVLETLKFCKHAGVEFLEKDGPKEGASSMYRYRII